METDPIHTNRLGKSYERSRKIIYDVSIQVPKGSVYGFLGRNGAGKTTVIRCLLGLLQRTEGKVRVLGEDPQRNSQAWLARIGYVAEELALPERDSVGQLASLLAKLYSTWDWDYFKTLARRLGVPTSLAIENLSLGQKRKAALTLALAPRPELLVLDEPAANLDAVVRREFLEEVIDLITREETTVFFSSHLITDVERIADRLGILSLGRLIFDGELDALKERVVRVRASFQGEIPDSLQISGTLREEREGKEILATIKNFQEESLQSWRGREGVALDVQYLNLEDIFIELTKTKGRKRS